MNYFYYVCPACKRESAEMTPHDVQYEISDGERQEHRGLAPIIHEILQCPCGRILTWDEMERKKDW